MLISNAFTLHEIEALQIQFKIKRNADVIIPILTCIVVDYAETISNTYINQFSGIQALNI